MTSTYNRNLRVSAIASQSQLTFLLKNPMDKYRRAAASAQYGMHQMSLSSLSPLGNRLSQTVILGLIAHLDFWPAYSFDGPGVTYYRYESWGVVPFGLQF